jgi:transglutaminase-like putative cysteine protease
MRNREILYERLTWDWPAVILILLCALFGSSRLLVTQATDNLAVVFFLAIMGTAIGLSMGKSNFRGFAKVILGFLYGAFIIPWQLGLAYYLETEWMSRLRDMSSRLSYSANQFFSGQDVNDPILFIAVAGTIFWCFGIYSGHRFIRHQSPWGMLLFGLAALVVQAYDSRDPWRAWPIVLFLFTFLLLLFRVRMFKLYHLWESSRTHMPFELNGSLFRLALIATIFIVGTSWVIPSMGSAFRITAIYWNELTSPWRSVQTEIGRGLFPLEGETEQGFGLFGKTISLGRGIPQSPDVVFTVEAGQQGQTPLRYYWRDRVYDRYEKGRWTSSYDEYEVWENPTEQFDDLEGRTLAEFEFRVEFESSLLHSASQPVYFSRSAQVSFTDNPDGSQDVAAVFPESQLLPGQTYTAASSIAVPTIEQLRSTGTEYPQWVLDRYLQLPEDFSPRLEALARILANGQSSSYDIAVAITDYLRRELEYVDSMPFTPFAQDPIEWAVFEQRQAFCNYYATAEILMLRSLGIPARFAVGYSEGEREIINETAVYTIRRLNGHAWPEVYFPGIGWVEFEPTANQDALIRPMAAQVQDEVENPRGPFIVEQDPSVAEQQQQSVSEVTTREEASVEEQVRSLISSMIILLLLGFGVILLWRRYGPREIPALAVVAERTLIRLDIQPPKLLTRMARKSEMSPMTKAFWQINEALGWMGQPPKIGDTSEQRAYALARLLPSLREEILTLNRDYQLRTYSLSKISPDVRASQIATQIRWESRRQQLKKRIVRLGKIFKRFRE